ncbi:MAG: FAD-dependent oxidoreductase [Parvularculaceae bacterium]
MGESHVIIVGGGVIGMSLAWRLTGAGARVSVIDAGAGAPPATNAAAGMLAPSFEQSAGPLAEALYAFSVESLARWRDFAPMLERDAGMRIDYRDDGILGAALNEAEEEELKGALPLKARGARSSGFLRKKSVRANRCFSAKFAAAFSRMTTRRSIRAACSPRFTEFSSKPAARSSPRVRHRLQRRNGAARGVTLESGETIEGDAVVIATGAFAQICDLAPPVFPVKGEALCARHERRSFARVVRTKHAYLCPKAGGRLVIGATEAPHEASLDPSSSRVEALKRAAIDAAPALSSCTELERWAGLRPGTPDGAPILGRPAESPEGLFLALGHYRNGVLLAPETAEKLTSLILEGENASALGAFSLDRFELR